MKNIENIKGKYKIIQEVCKDGEPYRKRSADEKKEIDAKVDQIYLDQFDEEFKKRMIKKNEVFEEVKRLESEAVDKLNKACELLDNLGVGYYFRISPLSQPYQAAAESFAKFIGEDPNKVDLDELSEIAEIFEVSVDTYHQCGGWQHSAVC